ncbi:hypothetical protein APS_1919 [Acetobacter pasteurianus subsp. pasteurianus LMG 1262 = NBRC 106471]|nr:hypothetical protein APS_1919 [Acetobacter pasteurianus subsp. pasteurianus LMG 1262 = NBRC 106471]
MEHLTPSICTISSYTRRANILSLENKIHKISKLWRTKN